MESSFGGGCAPLSYYVVPFAWLLGMMGLSCVLVRTVGMELEVDSLSGIRKKVFIGGQN